MSEPITAEQLQEFLAQPTPRSVSPQLRSLIKSKKLKTSLFAGLLFFAFGVVAGWVFLPHHPIEAILLHYSDRDYATGKVTSVEDTNYSYSMDEHDSGPRVKRFEYTFRASDDRTYQGVSYGSRRRFESGDHARVAYVAGNPSVSCLKDMLEYPFPVPAMLALVFVLCGWLLFWLPLRAYRRRLQLLRNGVYKLGQVLAVRKTGTGVDGDFLHRVEMQFDVDGLQFVSTGRFFTLDAKVAIDRMDSGRPLGLLHDPNRPHRFLLVGRLLSFEVAAD